MYIAVKLGYGPAHLFMCQHNPLVTDKKSKQLGWFTNVNCVTKQRMDCLPMICVCKEIDELMYIT